MYFTYVLLCKNINSHKTEFYTGYCEEINNRIDDHITHSVKTTKKFDKVELIYYEACLNKTDARKREIQLKTGFGRGYLKRRIENYIKSMRV
jgi:putative endonuclease